MDQIEFKNTLEKFADENTLIQKIQTKLSTIPNIQTLRYDVEILKYVANVVHNELKTHTDAEQKAVIIKTIKTMVVNGGAIWCGLEDGMIANQIEFLENNKQIKKLSWRKYIFKSVGGWIYRRLS